jgi:uncharacterized membrane protein YhfC
VNAISVYQLRYFKKKGKTRQRDKVSYQINKAGLEFIFLIVDNSDFTIIFFEINIVHFVVLFYIKLIDIAN